MQKSERLAILSKVFTPRAPVARRDRFAGRVDQIIDTTTALTEPGTHVVIYGERGVGKTSLANVLHDLLTPLLGDAVRVCRINCTTNDTFSGLWKRVLRELEVKEPENWTYEHPDPDSIRMVLSSVDPPAIVIFDEFDRLEDDEALSLMADTVKALSDHNVATKLVLVGVADSLEQLVGEHESIQRAVAEIQMPRMTQQDMSEIINAGLWAAKMTITDNARRQIERLAEGLPHFVHLLTLRAGTKAVAEDRTMVTTHDVQEAIDKALQNHSVLAEYQRAVQTSRRDTLYSRVLTACALAPKNRLGAFTAGEIREPLSRIMGKAYEIPAFSRHLKEFSSDDRGNVLKRDGMPRRYTYRFRNPLLQPFTVLTAIKEGWLPQSVLERLLGDSDPSFDSEEPAAPLPGL